MTSCSHMLHKLQTQLLQYNSGKFQRPDRATHKECYIELKKTIFMSVSIPNATDLLQHSISLLINQVRNIEEGVWALIGSRKTEPSGSIMAEKMDQA